MRFGSSCVLSPVAIVVRRSFQRFTFPKICVVCVSRTGKFSSKNLSHLDSQSGAVKGGSLSARTSSPLRYLFSNWSAAARTAQASTATAGRNRERLVVVALCLVATAYTSTESGRPLLSPDCVIYFASLHAIFAPCSSVPFARTSILIRNLAGRTCLLHFNVDVSFLRNFARAVPLSSFFFL